MASAGVYRIYVEIGEGRKGIFDLTLIPIEAGELRNVHYFNDRFGSETELKLRHYPRGGDHAQ